MDFVCLEALVKRRRALASGAERDSTRDREGSPSVHAFLAELRGAIVPTLNEQQREKVAAAERTPGDDAATQRARRAGARAARLLAAIRVSARSTRARRIRRRAPRTARSTLRRRLTGRPAPRDFEILQRPCTTIAVEQRFTHGAASRRRRRPAPSMGWWRGCSRSRRGPTSRGDRGVLSAPGQHTLYRVHRNLPTSSILNTC